MSFDDQEPDEVEDLAAKHGFSDTQEARFPREDLAAESRPRLPRAAARQAAALRPPPREAEEIYVVLSGGGRVKLDDEIVDIGTDGRHPRRPEVTRAFEAGDEGLELLAFGPRHDGDAETVKDFWAG